MLLQIRDYIRRQQVVSSQQLCRTFHMDETALEPIIKLWMQKGVIRLCLAQKNCQTRCFGCKDKPQYYEYI